MTPLKGSDFQWENTAYWPTDSWTESPSRSMDFESNPKEKSPSLSAYRDVKYA